MARLTLHDRMKYGLVSLVLFTCLGLVIYKSRIYIHVAFPYNIMGTTGIKNKYILIGNYSDKILLLKNTAVENLEYTYKDSLTGNLFRFNDLCIEEHTLKKKHILVTYDSPRDKNITVRVAGIPHANYARWTINMRSMPIPANSTFVNSTAYFMATTCSGNLHHLMTDSLAGKEQIVSIDSVGGNIYPSRSHCSTRNIFCPMCHTAC